VPWSPRQRSTSRWAMTSTPQLHLQLSHDVNALAPPPAAPGPPCPSYSSEQKAQKREKTMPSIMATSLARWRTHSPSTKIIYNSVKPTLHIYSPQKETTHYARWPGVSKLPRLPPSDQPVKMTGEQRRPFSLSVCTPHGQVFMMNEQKWICQPTHPDENPS
jgi:hypothetical protein